MAGIWPLRKGLQNKTAVKPAKLDLDDIDKGVPLTNNRLFVRMAKVHNALTILSRNGWYEELKSIPLMRSIVLLILDLAKPESKAMTAIPPKYKQGILIGKF